MNVGWTLVHASYPTLFKADENAGFVRTNHRESDAGTKVPPTGNETPYFVSFQPSALAASPVWPAYWS